MAIYSGVEKYLRPATEDPIFPSDDKPPSWGSIQYVSILAAACGQFLSCIFHFVYMLRLLLLTACKIKYMQDACVNQYECKALP